jgi:hypothetical protein
MIQAYFDESGTDAQSPITCVAGYLFKSDQCLLFDAEWKAILNRHGIKYFHMTECAHGTGQFDAKSKDERVEIEKRLIGIIKRRAEIGIVTSVCRSDFAQFSVPEWRHRGGEYILCLQWCLAGVAAWVAKHGLKGKISYFFEAGHRLESRANQAMNWLARQPLSGECLYHSHTFIQKEAALALQAADLLAWQWRRDWMNKFGDKRRSRRLDLENLLGLTHISCHLTAVHLHAICTSVRDESLRRFDRVDSVTF